MPFVEAKFKGNKVYVEVDEAGELVLDKGRAKMKYRLDDQMIYSPWPANLQGIGDVAVAAPAKPRARRAQASRAKPAAADPPPDAPLPDDAIVVYTDGACLGNPGPSGLGYVIRYPDGARVQGGEPLGESTNNIAELTAIGRVLELVEDKSRPLVIHTDSRYSIGVLARGWKAKVNQELIAGIRRELARFARVELRKVKGHAGVPDNELVDELARTAAERQEAVE
jgi:ribonuclease HI